ncbi:lipoprotein [Longispora fulva]|uniref:Iron uptake system component EfeO n=1 Tax=Longispora fulva TaxID=619741 RepID=A0A8J7GGQ8_9ACTN|nr:iron uptake system protein EfeO [Longispora fulva]MBG6140388.1 iron uptake system component EfeO [Longispora fulva]GIG57231.1 lipoprotein [Longispora fulva]
MKRVHRITALVAASLIAGGGLAGCSDDKKDAAAGAAIAVTATDTECKVEKADLPAGTHHFKVTNKGTKTTEFYVYADGNKVMGEVENITPGVSRELKVDLEEGKYQAACKPGQTGDGIRQDLTVTGKTVALSAEDQVAVDAYRTFVKENANLTLTKTTEFVAAVKAGDIAKAKELYPVARTGYERIEPIAEALGEIDAELDAREDKVEPGKDWEGFHRLEKDLWVTGDISKSGAIADALAKDVKELVDTVDTVKFTPLSIANGAKSLLDEVATGKVTGEEDRYSHTDLWDFEANVEGAKAVVAALRPLIDKKDAALGKKLDEQFVAVLAELGKYKVGEGFKLYTELSKEQVKGLADAVNGVGEPVSKVAALVASK